ncbi:hypothetical protein EDE15_4259 [Edaphobacter aggregans]|uniref:AAA domain-containing protein n=1 Tax=Edaphobacter aggregans TaxID=570835 RepID=A0A3R9R5V8_9BACT|nr:hypothetical protein [Edaphobacter aggregans]RSL18664.1 hypothetical protein EDE15_4259 [Edaphobacter aggregans]
MNDPKGSIWRKWDLHVHTPASLVHNYEGSDPWPQFLDELANLPPEFKVIGINDYMFLDGYKRVLAEKAAGKLTNIDLFLPVIEFRLDKFGGSQGHLSRVNYHVIFSDEIGPDLIEQQFLNALSSKYTLTPQYDNLRTTGQWKALPTRDSLADLGQRIINTVPEEEQKKFGIPLMEGFNNLCLNLDSISEALDSHYFKSRYATAIGKTEWADIKWNDHTIADKKTIINATNFVFTASATAQHYDNAKQSLTKAGVNDRLLDCSDAHAFRGSSHKDRLGNCFTWVKSDTTFAGLLQLLIEPDERIYVGDMPPQVARVQNNPTKYISSIEIKRKPTATIGEVWFNNTLPLNPGLVAIIGNKGKGKSALTDIIGLLCNTRQNKDFTFLSPENFRQLRDNKAKHFEATLRLESGTPMSKGLEEAVDENQPELVKYIPQNFLEKICTQLGRIEESEFDRELKKVIFSHVEDAYRLGQASLDQLIAYKATEATQKSELLKQELHRLNERIIALEEKSEPTYRKRIDNLLENKNKELTAHDAAKPEVVSRPDNDPARQAEISQTSDKIDAAKASLRSEEANILAATQQKAAFVQLIATADRLTARVNNLSRQIQTFISESQDDFDSLGLTLDGALSVTIDKTPIAQKRAALVIEQQLIAASLDPSLPGSLPQRKAEIERSIKKLENDLDEPNQRYHAYETALKNWDNQRLAILGNTTTLDTVEYFKAKLSELDAIPIQLQNVRELRMAKAKEIHGVIRELADTYRELYAPVNQFIETRPLAKEKFQLNFEVGL